MSASYGHLAPGEGEAAPLEEAREEILSAARQAGLFFTDRVNLETVVERLEGGVRICGCHSEEEARLGRAHWESRRSG